MVLAALITKFCEVCPAPVNSMACNELCYNESPGVIFKEPDITLPSPGVILSEPNITLPQSTQYPGVFDPATNTIPGLTPAPPLLPPLSMAPNIAAPDFIMI